MVMGIEAVTPKSIIRMFFPVLSYEYWFISVYLVLAIFFPVLNWIVNILDKQRLQFLLLSLLIVFAVIPSMHVEWLGSGSAIHMFIVMYLVGAYINKYEVRGFKKNRYNILAGIVGAIVLCVSAVVMNAIGKYTLFFIWGQHKIIPVIIAIFMLFSFMRIDIKPNKLVLNCASSVFGVYLLHNGRMLPIIINIFALDESTFYEKWYIPWHIFATVIVFVVCVVIDQIRLYILERPIMEKLAPWFTKCNKKLEGYLRFPEFSVERDK